MVSNTASILFIMVMRTALDMKYDVATVFRQKRSYKGNMETINDRWRRAKTLLNEGPWGKKGQSGSGDGSGNDGQGEGPRNPWDIPPGGPRRPQGPSVLDQLTQRLRGRFGGGGSGGGGGQFGGFGGGNEWRIIRNVGLALLGIWILFTSFHQIGAQEEGVITRFGSYAGKLSPGVGLTLPSPIDHVTKLDVQAIDTIDIPDGAAENLVLTGDQNIIDLAYSVRWDIKNAENFLFQLAEPQATIKEVAESAMREVLSTVALNDAMGPARSQVEQRVQQRMQTLLNDYKAGVQIRGVAIKKADPPDAVNDAFKAVTVAQQNRQANINNANAYAQQISSRAQGEATAFDKVFEQYRLSPEVTRKRMYYETMEDVLSRLDKTIVEPNGVAPYLPLGKAKGQVVVEEDSK